MQFLLGSCVCDFEDSGGDCLPAGRFCGVGPPWKYFATGDEANEEKNGY